MNVYDHPAVASVWAQMEEMLNAGGEEGIPGSTPISVSWSDLHAILSLLERKEDLHPSAGADGWICMECGHDQGITVFLPSNAWEQISPFPGGIGVLCLWCMDRVATEKGLGPIEGTAHFEGSAILIGNPARRRGLPPPDANV
jgi:hypothetical protein